MKTLLASLLARFAEAAWRRIAMVFLLFIAMACLLALGWDSPRTFLVFSLASAGVIVLVRDREPIEPRWPGQ